MSNGEGEEPTEDGEQPTEDGGAEVPSDEGGQTDEPVANGGDGSEEPTDGGQEPTDGEQPLVGETEPEQQDFDVEAAGTEPLTDEELAELDRNMTADRKDFGPVDDVDTAIAAADTTPSDAEPTAPA